MPSLDSTSTPTSTVPAAPAPRDDVLATIDLERLAQLVYQLMVQDLAIARERGG